MRAFYRSSVLAVTSLGLLGLIGCAEDNESELNKSASKGGGAVSAEPQPQNLQEYAARQKNLGTDSKGGAYSGGAKGGTPKSGTPKK